MNNKIHEICKKLKTSVIYNRRLFHRHAESGWTEFFTTSKIIEELERLGYEVKTGEDIFIPSHRMGLPTTDILESHYLRALEQGANPEIMKRLEKGYTGTVGIITRGNGPTIALRFDIDAVDVEESQRPDHLPNIHNFTSINRGVMHACGHDGHIAIGLGVADILSQLADEIEGTVKLIFQPSEEGVRGAKSIASSGIMDDVDFLLGGHLGIKKDTSKKLFCSLEGFLATTKIDAYFSGVSTHAGVSPELGKNALLAAATASLHLSSIPRNSEGATRINVGRLEAGSGRNVIPSFSYMQIETRGATSRLNEYMLKNTLNILRSSADMYQVDLETNIVGEAKSGCNDPEMIEIAFRVALETGLFTDVSRKSIDLGGSEDFSYLLDRVQTCGGKGVYMLFGSDIKESHHHMAFDFNEEDLINIVEFLSILTMNLFK